MGVSFYKMYYGLLESKLFIILTNRYCWRGLSLKITYLVFCDRSNIERKNYTFVTDKLHKKINESMEFEWRPVASFCITP